MQGLAQLSVALLQADAFAQAGGMHFRCARPTALVARRTRRTASATKRSSLSPRRRGGGGRRRRFLVGKRRPSTCGRAASIAIADSIAVVAYAVIPSGRSVAPWASASIVGARRSPARAWRQQSPCPNMEAGSPVRPGQSGIAANVTGMSNAENMQLIENAAKIAEFSPWRFSIAPMMDWTESQYSSMHYRSACAWGAHGLSTFLCFSSVRKASIFADK